MINKLTQQKLQLRHKYLLQRAELAKSSYGQKGSQVIIDKLQQLDCFKRAETILLYYSTQKEIDTHDLLEYYLTNGYSNQDNLAENKQKKIYLPSTSSLSITQVSKSTILKKGFGSIKEPAVPDMKLPRKIDLAIVPGVAFDKKGFRLGRGGGWYDQLFSKVKFGTKVGLSFDELVVEELPVEKHDRKVEIIITEKRIIDLR